MRGVCHDVSLNYIYLLLKVNSLWACRYQRQQDQRGFNKLPTVLWNLNFHVMHFPWFLHFGLWAKRLTLKASICSHIVILYSFNLLVCKPCSRECPSGWQVLIFFNSVSFVHHFNYLLLLQRSFGTHFLCFSLVVLVCACMCIFSSACRLPSNSIKVIEYRKICFFASWQVRWQSWHLWQCKPNLKDGKWLTWLSVHND